MSAQQRDDDMDQRIERELVRRIGEAEAAHRPTEVVLAGQRYRLVAVNDVGTTDDPSRDYDPARMLAAIDKIEANGGGLRGLDIEAFLEELRESDTADERPLPTGRFDAETARAKVQAASGALAGLDVEAFMEEIMESRIQDTPGRRWP